MTIHLCRRLCVFFWGGSQTNFERMNNKANESNLASYYQLYLWAIISYKYKFPISHPDDNILDLYIS